MSKYQYTARLLQKQLHFSSPKYASPGDRLRIGKKSLNPKSKIHYGAGRISPKGVCIICTPGVVEDPGCTVGVGAAGVGGAAFVRAGAEAAGAIPIGATEVFGGAAAAGPPETLIGVPPVIPPPPMGTTRVDRIGVFPCCVRFDPSCSGIISFRVPLSRTIRSGVISVIV